MKLEKAIEILKLNALEDGTLLPPDYVTALKLGIEALNRLDHCRRWTSSTWGSPLPGETKE